MTNQDKTRAEFEAWWLTQIARADDAQSVQLKSWAWLSWRTACAQQSAQSHHCTINIDALANEIRRVDGSNALGAGALAEALIPFLSAQSLQDALDAARANGVSWDSGFLTVVYKGIEPGPEAQELCIHPKASAMSWSHAINDRDAAIATQGASNV